MTVKDIIKLIESHIEHYRNKAIHMSDVSHLISDTTIMKASLEYTHKWGVLNDLLEEIEDEIYGENV